MLNENGLQIRCAILRDLTFLYVFCIYEYIISLQVKVAEGIPLKRLGKPEEVAGMTTFLALNPAADYITGHCFNVDGGIAMGA